MSTPCAALTNMQGGPAAVSGQEADTGCVCAAVVATYSGSTEGLYAPSQAQAQLDLSTSCGKHGDLLHKVRLFRLTASSRMRPRLQKCNGNVPAWCKCVVPCLTLLSISSLMKTCIIMDAAKHARMLCLGGVGCRAMACAVPHFTRIPELQALHCADRRCR